MTAVYRPTEIAAFARVSPVVVSKRPVTTRPMGEIMRVTVTKQTKRRGEAK